MNKDIRNLEPKAVWKHFAEICAIPHPSYHEDAMAEYIVNFAKAHNIEHHVDQTGNVILRKPAAPGLEDRKGIILQAHLDMVPQKNGDKVFDFEKDPIEAYVDGEWVTANGTTLGADNGMGMAAILAVIEDDSMAHGPIEGLFTRTEETGMIGAFGLKPGLLKGDILLNLDSETEGELYVGCAGGLDANISLKYTAEKPAGRYKAVKVEVKGLKGGHSGMEIILQRANANKLLFRFLREQNADKTLAIAGVDSGGLRNAIPREGTAIVMVPEARAQSFIDASKAFESVVEEEFKGIEDAISFNAAPTASPAAAMSAETSWKLINAVCGCPNGVIRMSTAMEGLVQTSTNLARVAAENGVVNMQCLLRSSSNSEKEELGQMVASVFELAGADVELSGAYNGWNPNMESPILHAMTDSYEALYGKRPKIAAIHAGLECGIIGGTYPNLDMISFGPTICFPHSPDEKVEIASVGMFWDFLRHTLANAPKK